MATKPSSILGYNPSRSACVTVPAGKMAVGFLPGEKPPAQYLGDIFERIDRWLEYVKDGAWTGNTTITGTFGASGLITASAGVTAAANQHVTVSGTGEFKHGDRTIQWAAAGNLIAQTGTISTNLIADVVTGGSVILVGGIRLHKGDRIKSMAATFDGVSSQNVTNFEVKRIAANGTATTIGSTTTSGLTGPVTLTITLTSTTLAANESFMVTASISASGVSVRNLAATYDHP